MNTHTLSVLVENKPGVLARIAADLGLVALRNSDRVSRPDHPDMRTPSDVVALVRDRFRSGQFGSAISA